MVVVDDDVDKAALDLAVAGSKAVAYGAANTAAVAVDKADLDVAGSMVVASTVAVRPAGDERIVVAEVAVVGSPGRVVALRVAEQMPGQQD